MAFIKRIVLDVLKPHQPNALECATLIANLDSSYRVKVTVEEVDEKTESITVIIEGDNIHFNDVVDTISNMGGSLHSIDQVEVTGAVVPGPDNP